MRKQLAVLTLLALFCVVEATPQPSGQVAITIHPETVTFKIDRHLGEAITIQRLGREAGVQRLRKLSKALGSDVNVLLLCRMLYKNSAGADFRPPGSGATKFLGGTSPDDWPLEPIELVDGVPFVVAMDGSLAGALERDEVYLDYCETNCVWSDFQYALKTAKEERVALAKLLGSSRWKRTLRQEEVDYLSGQIQ